VSGAIPTDPLGDVSVFTPLTTQSLDFSFGSDDFTIETWVNFGSATNGFGILAHKYVPTVPSSSEYFFSIRTSGAGQQLVVSLVGGLGFFGSEAVFIEPTTYLTSVNEWQHVAVVKEGDYISMYRNGVRVLGPSIIPEQQRTLNTIPSQPLRVFGTQTLGNSFPSNMFMQDYRIYKGVAKYTGNTPGIPLSIIGV
jgi:hypothetical protein